MYSEKGKVVSVNISEERGTEKKPIPEAEIGDCGIVGDSHAAAWHRQVSLLDMESIERFSGESGMSFGPGDFAENITTRGIDPSRAGLLDLLVSGDITLEVTQIGKKCHGDGCAVYQRAGRCVMPQNGVFCRVISGGIIRPGDPIALSPKLFKVRVITLSDRAYRDEYKDRAGPEVCRLLEDFFSGKRWHPQLESVVIPDDAGRLQSELERIQGEGADLIITAGGTGVGPRDITPEVVAGFCEKLIPGIMENIRVRYGREKPNARLSRSVAGVRGKCQVYALPGSVRAVGEYMTEILKTVEHLVFMLHGIDAH